MSYGYAWISTLQDFTWGNGLLISGGMLLAAVMLYGTKRFREHVVNENNPSDWKVPKVWEWAIK